MKPALSATCGPLLNWTSPNAAHAHMVSSAKLHSLLRRARRIGMALGCVLLLAVPRAARATDWPAPDLITLTVDGTGYTMAGGTGTGDIRYRGYSYPSSVIFSSDGTTDYSGGIDIRDGHFTQYISTFQPVGVNDDGSPNYNWVSTPAYGSYNYETGIFTAADGSPRNDLTSNGFSWLTSSNPVSSYSPCGQLVYGGDTWTFMGSGPSSSGPYAGWTGDMYVKASGFAVIVLYPNGQGSGYFYEGTPYGWSYDSSNFGSYYNGIFVGPDGAIGKTKFVDSSGHVLATGGSTSGIYSFWVNGTNYYFQGTQGTYGPDVYASDGNGQLIFTR